MNNYKHNLILLQRLMKLIRVGSYSLKPLIYLAFRFYRMAAIGFYLAAIFQPSPDLTSFLSLSQKSAIRC